MVMFNTSQHGATDGPYFLHCHHHNTCLHHQAYVPVCPSNGCIGLTGASDEHPVGPPLKISCVVTNSWEPDRLRRLCRSCYKRPVHQSLFVVSQLMPCFPVIVGLTNYRAVKTGINDRLVQTSYRDGVFYYLCLLSVYFHQRVCMNLIRRPAIAIGNVILLAAGPVCDSLSFLTLYGPCLRSSHSKIHITFFDDGDGIWLGWEFSIVTGRGPHPHDTNPRMIHSPPALTPTEDEGGQERPGESADR